MAVVRRTLEEIQAQPDDDVDWAKVNTTTEDDIRRQMIDDGEDPDAELRAEDVISPQFIRKRLGMTQEAFAKALRIPLATLRNWEQNRVSLDPVVRSLLRIVARDPKRALQALAD